MVTQLIIPNKNNKIMKFIYVIYWLLFLLLMTTCSSSNSKYENALIMFENYFSEKELESFKNNSEKTAVFKIKEGKNKSYESFFRHDLAGKEISYFFETKMIDDFDFMSDIMLTCLHRKYNKKKYQLEDLILEKRWEYNDLYYCLKKRKEKAKFLYNSFSLNDTIYIIQPMKGDNAYDLDCPSTFLFNDIEEKLKIAGTILRKEVIHDSLYFVSHIKITSLSRKNFNSLEGKQSLKVGDTIKINLNHALFDYSKHQDFLFSY